MAIRKGPVAVGLLRNKVKVFEERLLRAGRDVTFNTYQDTEHWFFEEDRPEAFNPEAAQLAWERTIAYLRKQYPIEKSF
jgi:carboxymethylenebutenolidase